ncbi:MAG: glycosyl hydrolase, partial [Bacteroidota bacterium]
ITPQHDLGERPLRWNWQTPIHLSRHNQDILYMGANKVFRSFNKGDDFEAISDDLTQGGQKGDVPYGTLASIDESPLKFGLLYTGSDDGLVHVSRDAGHSWQKVSDALPQDLWVSRVEASHHVEGRVYISLNGYRWDDFAAYVYVSDDYGQNWTRIGTDLPAEPVNVIREDPHNPDLLFVGTDHAVYASLDRGKSFMRISADIPATPVHDLVIQPDAKHLLVGTHGRSLYRVDIAPVEALQTDQLAQALHLYPIKEQKHRTTWGDRFSPWSEPNTPELDLVFFAKTAGNVQFKVTNPVAEITLYEEEWDVRPGLSYQTYDLTVSDKGLKAWRKAAKKEASDPVPAAGDNGSVYLSPGTYQIEIVQNGQSTQQQLIIK